MRSGEPTLVNNHKISYFHESPLQVPVYVATDLTHPGVTTARMYARHQTRVAGQMRWCRESIDSADFQH
jgi:hypothetical protein